MHIIYDQTVRDLLGQAADTLDLVTLKNTDMCVSVLDHAGRVLQVSDGALKSMQAENEAALSGNYWWQLWPSDAQHTLKEAVSRGLSGHITQYWANYHHADGRTSYWAIRISPLHDETSSVRSVIAVSRELSAH